MSRWKKPSDCACGGKAELALTSDNDWGIRCYRCGNKVVDSNDPRTITIKVLEPRAFLYEQWEARNKRLKERMHKDEV